MQKIVQGLPILVVIAALGLIGFHAIESRKAKKKPEPAVVSAEKLTAENLPVDQALSESDRKLVFRAFDAPEELDAAAVVPENQATDQLFAVHPALLSEIEPAEPFRKSVTAEWNPSFQKDFESLRTEAVRNPDSEQNRATVNALMQKRQQRLAGERRQVKEQMR